MKRRTSASRIAAQLGIPKSRSMEAVLKAQLIAAVSREVERKGLTHAELQRILSAASCRATTRVRWFKAAFDVCYEKYGTGLQRMLATEETLTMAPLHVGNHVFPKQEHALQIDGMDTIPIFLGRRHRIPRNLDADVVVQNVDATEALNGSIDDAPDVRAVTHVTRDEHRPAVAQCAQPPQRRQHLLSIV